ncbi:MAG: SOS response-associated peptidase [Thermoanaerobaculia bacterium]
MCGRYTLTSPHDVAEHFGLDAAPQMAARFNIAPTQESLIVTSHSVRAGNQRLRADRAEWGFALPPRGKGATGSLVINARSEDVEARPLFRESFAERRCLVPASGFYEWRAIGRTKQPFYFSVPESAVLAFAGLWESGHRGQLRYVILTAEANAVVEPVHERMPVILEPEDYAAWLDSSSNAGAGLRDFFQPWPAEKLDCWPVGMRVNDAGFDDPSCILRLEGPVDLFMY